MVCELVGIHVDGNPSQVALMHPWARRSVCITLIGATARRTMKLRKGGEKKRTLIFICTAVMVEVENWFISQNTGLSCVHGL